jgi:D-alanyl-D-alanine carboxypeptidase
LVSDSIVEGKQVVNGECEQVNPNKDLNNSSNGEAAEPGTNDITERKLRSYLNDYRLPAIAVASNTSDGFVAFVAGVRKQGAPPLVNKTDQFHLGSLTKAMTATLLAVIINEGYYTWNTTLEQALPDLASSMSTDYLNVTLRQLTAQRGGIYNGDWNNDISLFTALQHGSFSAVSGRWELTQRTLSRPPSLPQGQFRYDNMNYIIIGSILDRTPPLSSNWEDLIRSRLLGPLGMPNCGFGPNPESNNTSIDNPWPHVRGPDGAPVPVEGVDWAQKDNPPALNPAGRVHCPMAEYNKFLQLHVDGASLNASIAIPVNLRRQNFQYLHAPYNRSDDTNPTISPYYSPDGWLAFDLQDRDAPSGYRLWHKGANAMNYAEAMVVIPGSGRRASTFMALTNVYDEGDAQTAVDRVIADMRDGSMYA